MYLPKTGWPVSGNRVSIKGPVSIWEGKYSQVDRRHLKEYYADWPFLGVIRVGDSVEGKMAFSTNDLRILEACASEVAAALETHSVTHFLRQMSDELQSLRSQYERIKDLPNVNRLISSIRAHKPELPLSMLLVPFPVREFRVFAGRCNYFYIKDLRHHNMWYI
jgi:hypothetical protein